MHYVSTSSDASAPKQYKVTCLPSKLFSKEFLELAKHTLKAGRKACHNNNNEKLFHTK